MPPPGVDPSSPEAVAAGGVLEYILTQVGHVYYRTVASVCISRLQGCGSCKAVTAGDRILTQAVHVY